MSTNHQNTLEIVRFVREHGLLNPERLIVRIEYNQQLFWMKRRPLSKKKAWHYVQGIVSQWVAVPFFYPTVSLGGPESLLYEAEQLRLFSERNIPVPRVIAVTDEFLITEDGGVQLHRHLKKLTDQAEIKCLLDRAVGLVSQTHQAGLCHGRPSLSDMILHNDVISMIDLEENPLQVMSLVEAQARDIWLFLLGVARYSPKNGSLLTHLFQTYQQGISSDINHALQRMVKKLRPVRIIVESLLKPLLGRDVLGAIMVNKMMELHFKRNATGRD